MKGRIQDLALGGGILHFKSIAQSAVRIFVRASKPQYILSLGIKRMYIIYVIILTINMYETIGQDYIISSVGQYI